MIVLPRLACTALVLLPQLALAALYQDVTTELGLGVNSTAFLGPGCAMADADGDGDLEVYVVDGMGDPNRLFRNDGPQNFVEAAANFNLNDNGYGKATTFVDFDNDGDQDFLLTRFGPTEGDRLFRNDGTGNFVDITVGSGFDLVKNYHTGAAWTDYDNDGLVDCFIGTYSGNKQNALMKNLGNGQFVDVAGPLGLRDPLGLCFQPGWIDYDLDGDMDLYLANDVFGESNKLFRNNGDGTFTDVSVVSGTNADLSTMGLAIGDVDNDGDPDLYMSNIYEGNLMLRNRGDGTFQDYTLASGTGVYKTCWGSDFLDYNNDGRLDLYVACMIPYTNMGDGPVPNKLYRNQGNFIFTDVSNGSGADNAGYSYGSCQGDYDGDGDLDIYVTNWYQGDGAPPSAMLENLHVPRGGQASDAIRITLVGTISNRDALGAKVELSYAFGKQYRWKQCGTSYVSCSEPTIHFGMRTAAQADYIKVYWPSGLVETVYGVPSGSRLTLVEGQIASDVEQEPRHGQLHVVGMNPNPMRAETRIVLSGPTSGAERLAVFDAAGRRLRDLGAPREGVLRWDGRDASGAAVPAGAYFVRVDSPFASSSSSRRVIVVR
ncbi:MAG: VCBS repeat-containing protein [Candidatus Eisenbacteria bacterium]|nr:VCBS repeat-containing protein [Candidatus Eisenbacteria bacterium]MCC7143559.1 VCBS repeat-containing protein [Candidatus Eisenbacteria bacterium]